MPIIAMIASGLFSFFNKTIATGLLGKLIFLVIVSWVISVLLAGIVSLTTQFFQIPALASVLGVWGDIGAFAFHVFSFAVRPGLSVALGSRVVVFIIRRLPVVG